MTDPAAFDSPIRREGERAVRDELVARLHQHGVTAIAFDDATDAQLADLLTAVDAFESAVRDAGGDLFVDSPDSSEPESPELVLPHPHDDERVDTYTRRVNQAAQRLRGGTDR